MILFVFPLSLLQFSVKMEKIVPDLLSFVILPEKCFVGIRDMGKEHTGTDARGYTFMKIFTMSVFDILVVCRTAGIF